MRTAQPSTVAVVVAHDRADLLQEALAALKHQTVPPTAVVVIDNASGDDSVARTRSGFPDADVVPLDRNTGGAGGFAAGLAVALDRYDPDWVWLMDDDTIPTPTALEALLAAVEDKDVVLAGSRVVWTDGADHPMNTPRRKPFAPAREVKAAPSGAFPVRSSSFVSMLVSAPRVRAAGLPIADYFIWNDDFEFSTRILRGHRGLHVPASVVVHKTKARADTDADPGARFYFEVRNKTWLMLYSNGLNPMEKLLYTGSTLRRWGRAIRRSRERGSLVSQLGRGLADGARRRPRGNDAVLVDLGRVSTSVATMTGAIPIMPSRES